MSLCFLLKLFVILHSPGFLAWHSILQPSAELLNVFVDSWCAASFTQGPWPLLLPYPGTVEYPQQCRWLQQRRCFPWPSVAMVLQMRMWMYFWTWPLWRWQGWWQCVCRSELNLAMLAMSINAVTSRLWSVHLAGSLALLGWIWMLSILFLLGLAYEKRNPMVVRRTSLVAEMCVLEALATTSAKAALDARWESNTAVTSTCLLQWKVLSIAGIHLSNF